MLDSFEVTMLPRSPQYMNQPRFWFILQQDVDRPIGGVKQIYTVASILSSLGYFACVVQGTSAFRPAWFPISGLNFRTIGLNEFSFQKLDVGRDIVVIPETFLPLVPRLSRLKVVIFNQNMHYLFGEKFDLDPAFVMRAYSSPNILAVLTVSDSDYCYALNALPVPSDRIFRVVNAIEDSVFSFNFSPDRLIAYMPRKNSSHSLAIVEILRHRPWFVDSGWSFVPISNKSLVDVASILSKSSLFLSFGHPEGFGLPIAEAIVSGCSVIGYDGIGGSEIYQLCKPFDVFTSVPFRDFNLFINGVRSAMNSYQPSTSSELRSRLCKASSLVSSRYSSASMIESVQSFVHGLEL